MSIGQGILDSNSAYIGSILWEMDIATNYNQIFIPSSFYNSSKTAKSPQGHITYPQIIDMRLPIPSDLRGSKITDSDLPADWIKYGPGISPNFQKQFSRMTVADQ